ncbi:hypothetical protein Esti_003285 [Eimeria stiedai]
MGSKAAEAAAAGKTKERAKRVSAAVEQEEEGAAATPEELAAADFPRGKKRKQQQEQQQQQERKKKRQHLLDGGEEKQQQEGPESSGDSAAATRAAAAAAIDAAVAADPYLLEDAAYLRRDTRWLNKQRVLVLGSRGLTARTRLLLDDWKRLLPHHKAENKWEKKEKLQNITELCQLRSCNSVLYLEQRKNDALLHIAKVPLGPTFIARLMNGFEFGLRCGSLGFDCGLWFAVSGDFARVAFVWELSSALAPPLGVFSRVRITSTMEAFEGAFLTGLEEQEVQGSGRRTHVARGRGCHCRWSFRIAPLVLGEGGDANNPHRQTYIEIGPRFVMDPVKILEGSFSFEAPTTSGCPCVCEAPRPKGKEENARGIAFGEATDKQARHREDFWGGKC